MQIEFKMHFHRSHLPSDFDEKKPKNTKNNTTTTGNNTSYTTRIDLSTFGQATTQRCTFVGTLILICMLVSQIPRLYSDKSINDLHICRQWLLIITVIISLYAFLKSACLRGDWVKCTRRLSMRLL